MTEVEVGYNSHSQQLNISPIGSNRVCLKKLDSRVGPESKKSMKKWTHAEDQHLIHLAELNKGKKWKWVADQIPGKKDSQCRSRWERIRPGMKQGRWTPEEDELLKKIYSKYGDKWSELAKHLTNRTGKQVRDRLKNVLDPKLEKKEFSPEDDEKIYKLFEERGPKWKEIQQEYFPDRTADFIKNRFYSHYRKFKQRFSNIKLETNVKSDSIKNESCVTLSASLSNDSNFKNKVRYSENKFNFEGLQTPQISQLSQLTQPQISQVSQIFNVLQNPKISKIPLAQIGNIFPTSKLY